MVVIEEKVEAIFPLQTKNINNVKPKSKKIAATCTECKLVVCFIKLI